MSEPAREFEGATVVINHRVRHGREADYNTWLDRVGPVSRLAPGHLDLHVIRPVKGLTSTFTIVIRFDTADNLRNWMTSTARSKFIEEAHSLLVEGDTYTVRSGLDFWFNQPDSGAKVPVRWKQLLVTWSAIYPLGLIVSLAVIPLLRALGLPDSRVVNTLPVSGLVLVLMVYVVMPRYTRLVRKWLYA
jgi:antibiotic biosynthesis monooxygenase (ABM) superfamily enzyme